MNCSGIDRACTVANEVPFTGAKRVKVRPIIDRRTNAEPVVPSPASTGRTPSTAGVLCSDGVALVGGVTVCTGAGPASFSHALLLSCSADGTNSTVSSSELLPLALASAASAVAVVCTRFDRGDGECDASDSRALYGDREREILVRTGRIG